MKLIFDYGLMRRWLRPSQPPNNQTLSGPFFFYTHIFRQGLQLRWTEALIQLLIICLEDLPNLVWWSSFLRDIFYMINEIVDILGEFEMELLQ